MRGLCAIDDDDVLAAIDTGELRCFSAHLTSCASCTEAFAIGCRCTDVSEVEVVEAGPSTNPADERAYIASIGGREPLWWKQSRSRDLHGRLRHALKTRVPMPVRA